MRVVGAVGGEGRGLHRRGREELFHCGSVRSGSDQDGFLLSKACTSIYLQELSLAFLGSISTAAE
jgi:hypothetical protein